MHSLEPEWKLVGHVGVDSATLRLGDPHVPNEKFEFTSGLGDGYYEVQAREYRGRYLEVKVVLCTPAEVDKLFRGSSAER